MVLTLFWQTGQETTISYEDFEINGDDAVVGDGGVAAAAPVAADDNDNDDEECNACFNYCEP